MSFCTKMSSNSADDNVVLDYKKLLEQVEEIRNQDVGLESVQSISRVMSIAEELVDKVKKPREIGLDAKVLEISSAVVQQNAERFDSGFRPEEFADKLINKLTLHDTESSQTDSLIWQRFREKFSHLLPLAPRFDYLLGTIDKEKVQRKVRQPRQPQSRNEGTKELIKVLANKSTMQDNEIGQQHILDYISRLLVKTYRRNGEKPISYFKVVLSPNSLEETCQNILHIAFLVRDSFVKISTGEFTSVFLM
ncbi:hypothetical protein J437_LFUL004290 [Ladona fulva]|uniref:Non-structural maintenance of chromosomes element 4 n=1 Tax=Ladona fulva TaxID=123851 RepID=A0A8K0JXM2_LADFU|nr:hypothetical protein J437_LFUL004290 [Ladona fulva]